MKLLVYLPLILGASIDLVAALPPGFVSLSKLVMSRRDC
jgi:hypothetical protein